MLRRTVIGLVAIAFSLIILSGTASAATSSHLAGVVPTPHGTCDKPEGSSCPEGTQRPHNNTYDHKSGQVNPDDPDYDKRNNDN